VTPVTDLTLILLMWRIG